MQFLNVKNTVKLRPRSNGERIPAEHISGSVPPRVRSIAAVEIQARAALAPEKRHSA